MAKRALGRGLEALIPQHIPKTPASEMDMGDIVPNLRQPRKHFDPEELENLAASIRSVGLIEPIVLRRQDGKYEIIAGERRYRAAKLAGLERVPVIIKDVSDDKALEMALIENIQRADLNPIEEAQAYQVLLANLHLRQEDLAKEVGKSRAAIANALRLLTLPENIRQYLIDGRLSAGHARALLSLKKKSQMETLAQRAAAKNLSVRELEQLAARAEDAEDKPRPAGKARTPDIARLEERLEERLGSKSVIRHSKKGGRIEITYYDNDDLERILEIIGAG